MSPFRVFFLTFLAGMGGLIAVSPPSPDAPPSQERIPEPSVESLISDLSSDSYQVREEATLKLWSLGETALEDLKKAAAGDDPEVTFRTSKLIRNIEHFITPETDPELMEHVESYKKANPERKMEILRRIALKKGWHQILKLYAAETDPQLREQLRDLAYGSAITGARENLAAGKDDEARRLLELSPRDDRSLIALANFHRAQGTLDAERLKAATGPADWRAALARAAGDTRAAAEAAREAGDEMLAAAMGLFDGDFLPWLELQRSHEEDPFRLLYMDIIAGRWDPAQQDKAAKSLARLSSDVTDSRDDKSRAAAADMLFLAGYPELGEAEMPKLPVPVAVSYYSTLERFDEAFSTLGLDPSAPDFSDWVDKKFATYLNQKRFENDRAQDESSAAEKELHNLAFLMSQLGLHKEMASAFEKPLLAMSESDQEDFLTLLSALFSNENGFSNTATLAQFIGGKWADADEGRWRQLVNLAFGEDDFAIQWWDWTEVLDAQASFPDRFEGVLGLFGFIPDPKRSRDRWLDLAWQAVEKGTPAQKSQYLKRIGYISDFSSGDGRHPDMATALKVFSLQSTEDRGASLFARSTGLSLQGKWNEVADIFTELIAGEKGDKVSAARPDLHAYLAASLRRAGREAEAKEQDAWVEKLALWERNSSLRISGGYAFGGDTERADLWLARHAIEESPSLEGYENALTEHSSRLLEKGFWKGAAALAEAVALRASEEKVGMLQALNLRLKADLPRAVDIIHDEHERSMEMLTRCHSFFPAGGWLADHFYPALRRANLVEVHDQFFEGSWKVMSDLTTRYPNSEQILNTSAWLAARAVSRLPEAEVMSRKALELNPDQAAYLDTLAEIYFARKDRKSAIKWSKKAVNFSPGDAMIRRQYERFLAEPFPGE